MSNRKPMFAAEVKPDLTLRFINPAQFKQHLVPLAGDVVMVTAEKIRNHRTNKQNHYYWGGGAEDHRNILWLLKTRRPGCAASPDAAKIPAQARESFSSGFHDVPDDGRDE